MHDLKQTKSENMFYPELKELKEQYEQFVSDIKK